MSEKVWGPRVYEASSQGGEFYGFNMKITKPDIDLIVEMMDKLKGVTEVRIRKSQRSGKWYTYYKDPEGVTSEVEVRKREDKPKMQDGAAVDDSDSLPF